MSEELRPCPLHGDPKAMAGGSYSKNYAYCQRCDWERTPHYRSFAEWNNAHAWKELDAAKEREAKLRDVAERLADLMEYLEAEHEHEWGRRTSADVSEVLAAYREIAIAARLEEIEQQEARGDNDGR